MTERFPIATCLAVARLKGQMARAQQRLAESGEGMFYAAKVEWQWPDIGQGYVDEEDAPRRG